MPYLPTVDAWFEEIVLYILAAVVLLICLGCIYAFFRAIILFVFSNGKADKMNVRGADQYTAKNVFTYMWKILTKITGLWNIMVESQEANKMNGQLYYDI